MDAFCYLCFAYVSVILSCLFIISRVAGLSAGPGLGDEVPFPCFSFVFSLPVFFSDAVCCFKYSVKLSSV